MTSPQPPVATDSYLDLYQAALDVARAAERVSSRRSESRRRKLSRQTTANTIEGNGFGLEGVTEGGMMESFHSDMSRRTSSTVDLDEGREKKRMSQSTGDLGMDSRGRSMKRSLINIPSIPDTPVEELDQLEGLPGPGVGESSRPTITRSKSRSLSVVRTTSGKGKGRRAAGVAFMSFGLIFGFGGLTPSTSLAPSRPAVEPIHDPMIPTAATLPVRHPQPFLYHQYERNRHNPPVLVFEHSDHSDHSGHSDEPPERPSFQRLVGRTSAWACTTLYLTSRLPQIWKNVR